jgi:hypothetical protein
MHTIFWSENLKGRDHSEDLGVDGRIILEWILWKIGWGSVDWIHVAQVRNQWQGSCEHGNELSDSIKGRELLDQLSDCQLLKKDSAPWN